MKIILITTLLFFSTHSLASLPSKAMDLLTPLIGQTGSGSEYEGRDLVHEANCFVTYENDDYVRIEMKPGYFKGYFTNYTKTKRIDGREVVLKTKKEDYSGTSRCGQGWGAKSQQYKLTITESSVEIEESYRCVWSLFIRLKHSYRCEF